MTIIGQERVIVWVQPDGPGTQWKPFGIGEKGMSLTGKTRPGTDRAPVYGRNRYGQPLLIKMAAQAPGDLPSATISFFERGQMDIIQKALDQGCPIHIQSRITTCGALDNPNRWDAIDHYANGAVTSYSQGDAPSLEFNGEQVTVEGEMSFTHVLRILNKQISNLEHSEADAILSIAGMKEEDCNECGNGYPGADKILYAGTAAQGAAEAGLLYTKDGGSTWASVSADPFDTTAEYEDLDFVAVNYISDTKLRVVVGTSTTGAAKASVAWADVDIGAEGTTSWTIVTITETAAGDVVNAMAWLTFDRLFAASGGDIYVSNDQGESFDDAAVYTNATETINGFAITPDEDIVYAFGTSNLIIREVGASGIFETRVGPSGGGAFTAMAIDGDGTIFAGNGTSIFKNVDGANNAGNWTELKDFGSNKQVVAINIVDKHPVGGGEILMAVVDDTAGGTGAVWESVDGGATWSSIETLTNEGYNDAYFSEIEYNTAIVVGDVETGAAVPEGVIHRVAPQVS